MITPAPPTGTPLPNWCPPPRPERAPMQGRWCLLEPLTVAHAADLFAAASADTMGHSWTYLHYGPFQTEAEYTAWVAERAVSTDPLFFALVDTDTGRAVGVASYLRIDPTNGVIEVGHLYFSPALQGTTAATEAMYLMMRHAFDLGYRRYEWKCDSLNAPSRRAALRLGFQFEGIFRQAIVVTGRNRDTAWFSVIDGEWPLLRERFEKWLAPENFDAQGRQLCPLSEIVPLSATQAR
ncbi:GNAT family protein [Verrucomicrobium sp. BvORR034]|uniref:GNAT family N-acetyltransferase n=1 Tax=Verrucomicrobium sp. BvORR034 TaxID=1396418 RepID=UPI0006797076|nr:GNAT family protein [Verrucomicrobium sp. BvORR034]